MFLIVQVIRQAGTSEFNYMQSLVVSEGTIVSEGFKGGTRGAPIMPRDAVSRTANVGTVGNIYRHTGQTYLCCPRGARPSA